MDNIDKKIKEIFSAEITPPQSFYNMLQETFDKIRAEQKSKRNQLKFVLATACCSVILATGVVFGKDIQNFIGAQFKDFGLGDGISTAVENGYVGKTENEDFQNVQVIKNDEVIGEINTKIKVNEFIMSNSKLSLDFAFKLENKINEYIDTLKTTEDGNVDYENSLGIELLDLFIVDDENRIVFYNYDYYEYDVPDNNVFTQYCEQNKIEYPDIKDYMFGETSVTKEYYSNGEYIGIDNVYTFVSEKDFPHSKNLDLYFTKLQLVSEDFEEDIILQGNWKIHLDIPENMFNRTVGLYEILSCENENFNLYEVKLSDTDFQIGIEISNIEEPIYPEELTKIENKISNDNGGEWGMNSSTKEAVVEFYGEEKYANLWEEYMLKRYFIGDIINFIAPWVEGDRACYVENSNGEKYRLIEETQEGFKQGNKYDYRAVCDMNKYTTSDEIKIVIVMNGNPYEIKLRRAN